jgi:hypothetical protein
MAQKQGYGLQVGGRPIRTELATARSTGFFRRLDGNTMTEDDLERIFLDLDISRFWKPSPTERAVYNLSEGFFIDFGSHEAFKQAVKVRLRSFLPRQPVFELLLLTSRRNSLTLQLTTSTLLSARLIHENETGNCILILQLKFEKPISPGDLIAQPILLSVTQTQLLLQLLY